MAARLSRSGAEAEGREGEGEREGRAGGGVGVSVFDYSVDDFLSQMDAIGKLCCSSYPSRDGDLDSAELERFSSMITFLKEWRYLQYEPRTVRVPCESGGVGAGAGTDFVRREIELPQFSSAAVPSVGKSGGEADSVGRDFVLYAGGSVWALDWCPRGDDKHDSAITCEYLAVSAHPPGSNYHKIGASLRGRGVIQIWCLVTATESLESPQTTYGDGRRPKGRPKKASLVDCLQNGNQTSSTVKKPRGRPRKASLMDEKSRNQVTEIKKLERLRKRPSEEDAHSKVPKKRGRPRKYAPCSNFEKEDRPLSPVRFNLEETETILALPPPPDANPTENSKGRTMKGNFERQDMCLVASDAKLNADMDKELQCLEMAQDGHDVAANNEASPFPLVEPLDVALPLSAMYGKKYKRRLKKKQSEKPEFVVAENSIIQDITTTECQIVEYNSGETERNAEAKLATTVCCQKEMQLPKLVLCLAHYGKVAWDIKWKPFATSSTARMGYLAVLLGNGSLEVWEVPFPSTVQRLYSSNPSRGEGTDPRFLKLKPVFKCSKLTFGNRQSIPLTLEWSPSSPGDMILAGCHDGTVALWKFAIHTPCEDSRPLLIFTADSSPIRSIAWAPHDNENAEDANLFVVAGLEGLKFWDIRDPYHSLWEVNPANRAVVSVNWLKDPRCILMSLEDGTMRIFSLPKGANDMPVTGMPLPRKQFEGIFIYTMSLYAIWSIHASLTGLVAYCVTDGSVIVFQLNKRFLEPDPSRNRAQYFHCDHLKEEQKILELGPPFTNTIIPDLPLKSTKGPNRYIMGDEKAVVSAADPPPKTHEEKNSTMETSHEVDAICRNSFPSKLVALHKVRWNKNKGTERWLCYGGAAGIIRLQKISFDS